MHSCPWATYVGYVSSYYRLMQAGMAAGFFGNLATRGRSVGQQMCPLAKCVEYTRLECLNGKLVTETESLGK